MLKHLFPLLFALSLLLTACTFMTETPHADSFGIPATDGDPLTQSPSPPISEPITPPETEPTTEPPAPVFEPFTLAFTGDICIAENYRIYENAGKLGYSLEDCFSPSILARMRAADLLLVNCESAVSDRGTPLKGKAYTFRTSTEAAKGFLTMGADLIGLANNHVYDYGEEGFLDTIDTFADLGLPTVGAGRNAEEAYAPFTAKKAG